MRETTATTQKSTQKSNTFVSSHDPIPLVNDSTTRQVPNAITIGCDSEISSTAESNLTGEITCWRSKVGRPSGSTEEKQFHQKRKIIEVKNECARQFADLKKKLKKQLERE